MLTRIQAVDLAEAEMGCMDNHVSNLDAICSEAALAHCAAGVEQLRAAVARLNQDIAAVRAAQVQ